MSFQKCQSLNDSSTQGHVFLAESLASNKQLFSFARLIQKERHILTADIGTSPWNMVLIFLKLYFKIDICTFIYVCACMHAYMCVCVFMWIKETVCTCTPQGTSQRTTYTYLTSTMSSRSSNCWPSDNQGFATRKAKPTQGRHIDQSRGKIPPYTRQMASINKVKDSKYWHMWSPSAYVGGNVTCAAIMKSRGQFFKNKSDDYVAQLSHSWLWPEGNESECGRNITTALLSTASPTTGTSGHPLSEQTKRTWCVMTGC